MAGFRTCTQPPIAAERRVLADKLAVEENRLNGPSPSSPEHARTGPDAGAPILRAAIRIGTKWKNGRTLRVRFLNGSDKQKAKVRQYAGVWTEYANIKFDFVFSGPAEVRVRFDDSRTTWSAVGTECLAMADSEATVNFGDLPDGSPERNFSADILHEFGHVLGCIHEHQSPSSPIPWDKPAVYKYYKEVMGWSSSEVDINVLGRTNSSVGILHSEFDHDSIMIYPIPGEFTKGRYSSSAKCQLSAKDKAMIAEAYPPSRAAVAAAAVAAPASAPAPAVVTFNAMETRGWDDAGKRASKTQVLVGNYDAAPSLAVGLNWLDVSGATNVRVNAYATRIKKNSANIHLDTWSDTRLYSAGCTWFHAAAADPDFQIGQFSTEDGNHGRDTPLGRTTGTVKFARPYASPPKVIVWLNQLDLAASSSSASSGWRVRATATDLTARGFKLRLGQVDVASGSFSASKKGQAMQSGQVSYPAGTFKAKPTVLSAFSMLDCGRATSLRAMVSTDSVPRKMKWRIEPWSDSVINSAEASYIAFV
ncbi:hypothetical protein DL770_003536 [Monosporascus sp. CRB-9-2]|nr:hypothetical protein DL770_003536 [Monosporascus sp. CRB-9-2]